MLPVGEPLAAPEACARWGLRLPLIQASPLFWRHPELVTLGTNAQKASEALRRVVNLTNPDVYPLYAGNVRISFPELSAWFLELQKTPGRQRKSLPPKPKHGVMLQARVECPCNNQSSPLAGCTQEPVLAHPSPPRLPSLRFLLASLACFCFQQCTYVVRSTFFATSRRRHSSDGVTASSLSIIWDSPSGIDVAYLINSPIPDSRLPTSRLHLLNLQ